MEDSIKSFRNWNGDHILVVIDNFTKMAWVITQKGKAHAKQGKNLRSIYLGNAGIEPGQPGRAGMAMATKSILDYCQNAPTIKFETQSGVKERPPPLVMGADNEFGLTASVKKLMGSEPLKVRISLGVPGKARSQGLVERFNLTLKRKIKQYMVASEVTTKDVNDESKPQYETALVADWNDYIDSAINGAKGYNNTPHSTFKNRFTPKQVAEAFFDSNNATGEKQEKAKKTLAQVKAMLDPGGPGTDNPEGRKISKHLIDKTYLSRGQKALTNGDIVRLRIYNSSQSKKVLTWTRRTFMVVGKNVPTDENPSKMTKYFIKMVDWKGPPLKKTDQGDIDKMLAASEKFYDWQKHQQARIASFSSNKKKTELNVGKYSKIAFPGAPAADYPAQGWRFAHIWDDYYHNAVGKATNDFTDSQDAKTNKNMTDEEIEADKIARDETIAAAKQSVLVLLGKRTQSSQDPTAYGQTGQVLSKSYVLPKDKDGKILYRGLGVYNQNLRLRSKGFLREELQLLPTNLLPPVKAPVALKDESNKNKVQLLKQEAPMKAKEKAEAEDEEMPPPPRALSAAAPKKRAPRAKAKAKAAAPDDNPYAKTYKKR